MSKPKPHRLIFLTKAAPFNFLDKEHKGRRQWPLGYPVSDAPAATPAGKKPRGGRA